jgi:hypothetical protein
MTFDALKGFEVARHAAGLEQGWAPGARTCRRDQKLARAVPLPCLSVVKPQKSGAGRQS